MDKELEVQVPQQLGMLTPQAVADRSKAIHEIMAKAMREKVDYGVVPGCGDKPSLLKAGAEKLLMTFQLAPKVTVMDLSTPEAIRYRITVSLYSQAGVYLGDGVGEASTSEDKYAWRAAMSDAESNATLEVNKRIKYLKNGNSYTQIRSNPADQANTVLKMGKKRALVDAVLTVLGASDIFTQDIEDMETVDRGTAPEAPAWTHDQQEPARATAKQTAFIQHNFPAVGLDQAGLWAIIKGIAPAASRLEDLTMAQASKVIDDLKARHANQVERAKESQNKEGVTV